MASSCWARVLGDCRGGISGEHTITNSIWEGSKISVQGFSWCRDAKKEIPSARFTSNILCEGHNNGLSPVDQSGIDAFATLRQTTFLAGRQPSKRGNRAMVFRVIDGVGLERWCLKTAINFVHVIESTEAWSLDGARKEEPPDLFVRAAFGLERLQHPMGLYSVAKANQDVRAFEEINVAAAHHPISRHVAGMLYEFRGFRFLLWLDPSPLPPVLEGPSYDEQWRGGLLQYHLHSITWRGPTTQIVTLKW